jgi:hypothetical protein
MAEFFTSYDSECPLALYIGASRSAYRGFFFSDRTQDSNQSGDE